MAATRTHKSAAPAKAAKVAQATPATLVTSTAAAALPKEEGAAPVVSTTPEVAALAAPAAPAVRAAQPQATDARRQYVVGTVPIRHNGRVYGIGHDIELTDGEAQRLAGLVALVR